jgi:hypothetical protein
MSERLWKIVGGCHDGQSLQASFGVAEWQMIYDGFRYVVRHHDGVLLFSPDTDAMVLRSQRIIAAGLMVLPNEREYFDPSDPETWPDGCFEGQEP